VVTAAVVIVLLLFVLRPGASRLKSRIIASISSGVGRSVDIGSVRFRLLPRPGFDLEDLVVYDDPAFGAEPMLRASEVTAALRLTSLLRGRLEISRLDLTEPSLNLVHRADGRWNLEALVERSAHTPLAPTAKAKSEPRQGFPYIQATSARINFKKGAEKKPYALINADFSLWQDSENSWGVRLKAQPVRTDLNSNDTGILQVNGTWQRAEVVRDTPLEFSMEWSHAQLGQLTKLFTGSDRGWRGGVQLDVTLTGTPAKLEITSDASIQDFRRYDITMGAPLRLAAHCDAHYSSPEYLIHETVCYAPVGNGLITLKGNVGLPGSHKYELVLKAENVPASAGVSLAQHVKKYLAGDLVAGGMVRGSVSIEEDGREESRLRIEGKGEIADFQLASAANHAEIGPVTIPVILSSGDSGRSAAATGMALHKEAQAASGPRLEFGPFSVALGRTEVSTVRGWVNGTGYNTSVTGEIAIGKTLRLAGIFGLPALQTTAEGTGEADLQIAGLWAGWGYGSQSGFVRPQVTGTARLHNVHLTIRGTGGPVEISSAELQLTPTQARVEMLHAKAAETLWTGSLEMPRGCGTPGACELHFNLNASQIAVRELSEWVSPRAKERPWYRALESDAQAGPSVLGSLRASGRLTTDRLQLQNLSASRVSANLSLNNGRVQISELNAEVLGGKHLGAWQADFSAKPTVCEGSGRLMGVSLDELDDVMKDTWISGTASANYEIGGPCTAEFWNSAEGTVQFEVKDAALPHISLTDDEEPLKISHFSGRARLQDGVFEVKEARLDSPSGKFQLSGTASLNRDLDLKLARTANGVGPAYAVRGTVAAPRVTQLPGTEQARLKPQ
jgi:hypothetical protein